MAMACKTHRQSFFYLLPGATGHLLLALLVGATPTGHDAKANATLCGTKTSATPLLKGACLGIDKSKSGTARSVFTPAIKEPSFIRRHISMEIIAETKRKSPTLICFLYQCFCFEWLCVRQAAACFMRATGSSPALP